MLGLILVLEEEKCLMSVGFVVNLVYFKFDFLECEWVFLCWVFCEILLLLWVKVGVVGLRLELKCGEFEFVLLVFEGSNFVVLFDEL